MSPTKAVRESASAGGGQRLGDGLPVDGPITTFPEAEDEEERSASQ